MKLPDGRTPAALAAFLLSAFVLLEAHATSVVPLDIDDIIAGAQHVVHVRCTGNKTLPDAVAGIATVSTFDVLDRAKGPASRSLVVRQPGGELNGIAVNYHVPTFVVGEEYVLFVPPASKAGFASPVGLSQGVFDVVTGQTGKQVGNGRDFSELIGNADPTAVPAGVTTRLQLGSEQRTQLGLGDFMTLVRNKAGTK